VKEPSRQVDTRSETGIMTVEETARFFQKSVSWVYKNWKELGGRKLGGSLFFPSKEDLYELVFCKEERVAIRLHPEREPVHKKLVQNQKGGKNCRGKKKGGDTEPGSGSRDDNKPDSNRHGLLGTGK
jgi:hypothetical protein